MKSKSDKINIVLKYIVIENITTTSWLLKAAGCVVAKKRYFKTKLAKHQELRWKKRIKDKIRREELEGSLNDKLIKWF